MNWTSKLAVFFRRAKLLAGLTVLAYSPVRAGVIFALIPPDGSVSGPAGTVVGWGYSLANAESAAWFVSTSLASDSFANGTPTLLFDFPIVSPGQTVTRTFDPVAANGLFEFEWDTSAPS